MYFYICLRLLFSESGFVLFFGGGQIHPTIKTTNHLDVVSPLFLFCESSSCKSIFFISFFTCPFHVTFGCRFSYFPSTWTFNVLCKKSPSFLRRTCPYHQTPLAFAIPTTVSCKFIIFISSSVFLLSIIFTPHIALTIALSVLLRIAISLSFKHQVSLPCKIADLTQQRK